MGHPHSWPDWSTCLGYTKRIVCLANSVKHGGLCIAGREVMQHGFGRWIRPVSARPGAELSYLEYRYDDHQSPKLLDLIDVPLFEPWAHGHQTENHLVDTGQRWVKRGRAAFRRLNDLRESPQSLWNNAASTAAGHFNCVSASEAAQFGWSLCLVKVEEVAIDVVRGLRGEPACKASFLYNRIDYMLSVTDPAVRERFEPRGLGRFPLEDCGEIFLCISLGEAFKEDGRCHKLVASVITERPL
jgi:hypothetical protein